MEDPKAQAIGIDSSESLNTERMSEFVELYSSNYQRVQFFLMSLMPTADDAADVLQETSVILWKKFETFESGTDFFAWACQIARFQSMKHRDRQRRAARILDNNVVELIADEASRDSRDFSEAHAALAECLEKLSETDRKLIVERYQPGSSVMEIAGEFGWSANRLSKKLAKIRHTLLSCIQRTLAIEGRH